jgi:hypothetical protein
VTARLLLLAGACVVLWALLAVPARSLGGGDDALVYSSAAALLCGVPMLVSAAVTMQVTRRDPRLAPVAVLGATGARMLAVLGGALLLTQVVPSFRAQAFWLWLAVFYVGTLVAEVVTLVTGRQPGWRAGGNRSTLP